MTDDNQDRTLHVTRVDADVIRAQHINDPAEDRRVAWLIAGIGVIILVVLSAGNVMALLRAQDAQKAQLKLAECNRRVIVTINARQSYAQQLSDLNDERVQAGINLSRNLAEVSDNPERTAALRIAYANQLERILKQQNELREQQAKFQYPDLSECEN